LIEAPSSAILSLSELDPAYEEAVEQSIKMSTGPSPEIAADYMNALETFMNLYNNADSGEQAEWSTAKKQLEKTQKELQDKLDEAQQTINDWENKMRANDICGFFKYAEGVVNGELVRRLDWEMSSTEAFVSPSNTATTDEDGNVIAGNHRGNEIIIEEYTLTAAPNGDLIYTQQGNASKITPRIKELASMLTGPFYKQERDTDMKPGGGRPFSGNTAHSDKKSSIMLRSPEKPTATVVELPDWTDGRIQELIDEYNRRCAEGMAGWEARDRKVAMDQEIQTHQGNLINQLQTVHNDNGERKETLLLLSMWMKRKETWENTVNSLGEGCAKEENPEAETYDIDEWVEKFTKFCDKKLLPGKAASYILDEIQNILNLEEGEIKRIEEEKETYLEKYPNKKDREDPTVKGNIEKYDALLDELNESHRHNLEQKKTVETKAAKGDCYKEITVDVTFERNQNKIDEIDEVLIADVAEVMNTFPSISLTITGYHGAGLNRIFSDNADIEKDEIESYDPKDPDSQGGTTQTTGDIAMLRAEAIKKRLAVKDKSKITCTVGAERRPMFATFTLE